MIEVARREYPGIRFGVDSMMDLALADGSLAGLVAWYSLIHVPDEEISAVLAHFQRVLRPGGSLLLGDAAFAVETERTVTSAESKLGGTILALR
jgi:ubiquinone/menaquinone biosynthesis C-methylase UbiE